MGAIGGTVFHSIKGFRNAPSVSVANFLLLLTEGSGRGMYQFHKILTTQSFSRCSHVHSGLEIRGSNGSKCYHVFSFATGMLMW